MYALPRSEPHLDPARPIVPSSVCDQDCHLILPDGSLPSDADSLMFAYPGTRADVSFLAIVPIGTYVPYASYRTGQKTARGPRTCPPLSHSGAHQPVWTIVPL